MTDQPYDPVGAMGGLFAPAYIHGNPEAEAAAAKWQAENFALTPAMVEATRGPSQTVTNPAVGRGIGGGTTTVPGSVDPAALKILAQGGKYKGVIPAPAPLPAPAPAAVPGGGIRDQIAGTLAGRGEMHPQYGPIMRQPTGPVPPGMQRAYSPLQFLMGDGDQQGFMQGPSAGGV